MGKWVTLLAAALMFAALPAGAHAQDAFTKKTLSFDTLVGPNGDKPCTVVGDLYTPNGLSASNRAPAVLATNGFGGSKDDFTTLGATYAKRGFVFLAYSGLGFGGSGCKIQLDDPDWDGKAGRELVSFLGGTKAATDGTKIDYVEKDGPGDPRVGMIGGSYGGQIQFAIAGVDPRMDALVPAITWNDLSYSLAPNNTDYAKGVTSNTPGVAKLDWPALFTALGVARGVQEAFADPSRLIGACPNFDDRACRGLVYSGAFGYPMPETIELLRHASVSSYVQNIKIPVFLSQGQSDTLFNLNEAVATYQALRAQGTPVKMLWRSAGHSGGGIGGEWSESEPEKSYESRLTLEWLEWWLKGTGDAPKLDFTFLRDWQSYEGDAAPAVGHTPTYPAGTDTPVFLSGTSALTFARDQVTAGRTTIAAVPGTINGSGNGFTSVPVPDGPGLATSFTSGPLAETMDVVGVPRVTVRLDAPTFAASQGTDAGGKLVLFAKLIDVGPDGTEVLPRNQLSAARVADVTKPVTIELPGLAHRFEKGHSLRLVLTTSNSTNRGNVLAGPVTILTDPGDPAVLTLPRLGEQAGALGAGPNGTTTFRAAAGAPKPLVARRPAFARDAAKLRSNRRCVSRRRFSITLRRPRGDRIRTVTITINGKRKRTVSGRRTRVDLRGLPKGTVRVAITARTVRGRTLRSARTYRTCVARRR